jgi:hypothetical protein
MIERHQPGMLSGIMMSGISGSGRFIMKSIRCFIILDLASGIWSVAGREDKWCVRDPTEACWHPLRPRL